MFSGVRIGQCPHHKWRSSEFLQTKSCPFHKPIIFHVQSRQENSPLSTLLYQEMQYYIHSFSATLSIPHSFHIYWLPIWRLWNLGTNHSTPVERRTKSEMGWKIFPTDPYLAPFRGIYLNFRMLRFHYLLVSHQLYFTTIYRTPCDQRTSPKERVDVPLSRY